MENPTWLVNLVGQSMKTNLDLKFVLISEVVRGGARGAMASPIILPRPAMKVVEVVNNL